MPVNKIVMVIVPLIDIVNSGLNMLPSLSSLYCESIHQVRESALWHCEPCVMPGWELANSKPFFDNLHR